MPPLLPGRNFPQREHDRQIGFSSLAELFFETRDERRGEIVKGQP